MLLVLRVPLVLMALLDLSVKRVPLALMVLLVLRGLQVLMVLLDQSVKPVPQALMA